MKLKGGSDKRKQISKTVIKEYKNIVEDLYKQKNYQIKSSKGSKGEEIIIRITINQLLHGELMEIKW